MRNGMRQYPPGSFGCAQFLILPVMFFLGAVGYLVGGRWGLPQAIGGLLAGVILSAPVFGLLMAAVLGILWLFERKKA